MTATDESSVRAVLEAVGRCADAHDWDGVAAAFAPSVELDYGAPEQLTPAQIVARWQPLLTAFERTEHALGDVRIDVRGDTATATAAFAAGHDLEGESWTLEGRYEWTVARSAGTWRITRMKMIPGASTGNPALLDRAKARAARH